MKQDELIWYALVRTSEGLLGLFVTARNRHLALVAVTEQVGACHVVVLRRSSVSFSELSAAS